MEVEGPPPQIIKRKVVGVYNVGLKMEKVEPLPPKPPGLNSCLSILILYLP